MEYTVINGTNLKSSRIGLGTWAMGGGMLGGTDDMLAINRILRQTIADPVGPEFMAPGVR